MVLRRTFIVAVTSLSSWSSSFSRRRNLRILSAEQAAAWGLVQQVIPDADFAAQTAALAERLAGGPTRAYARAKELYNRALSQPLETQLEEERQSIARSATTRDFREGVGAFLEKRPARFEGR